MATGNAMGPSQPEKQMSSRLMTMKFMQRAAASSPSPSSPATATRSDSQHPSKRRRTGEYNAASTPGTPSSQPPSTPRANDLVAINAALAAEEQARHQALARHGNVTGETHWILNIPGITPTSNGTTSHEGLDVSEEEDDDDDDYDAEPTPLIGRRTYGNFKRKPSPRPSTANEKDDLSDPDASSASESSAADRSSASEQEQEEEDHYAQSRQKSSNTKSRNQQKRKPDKDLDSIKSWKSGGAISGNRKQPYGAGSGGGGGGGNINKDYAKSFSSSNNNSNNNKDFRGGKKRSK